MSAISVQNDSDSIATTYIMCGVNDFQTKTEQDSSNVLIISPSSIVLFTKGVVSTIYVCSPIESSSAWSKIRKHFYIMLFRIHPCENGVLFSRVSRKLVWIYYRIMSFFLFRSSLLLVLR